MSLPLYANDLLKLFVADGILFVAENKETLISFMS